MRGLEAGQKINDLVDGQKLAAREAASLRSEIEALKRPAFLPPMPMRELALHLHGRVRRFAEMNWEQRYVAMDAAVRDALSLGQLSATGRPVDWMDSMMGILTTRTEIKPDFWKKRGDVDWSSIGREDEYKRDTATHDGDDHFYAVEFDRANVLSLWPEDFDEPVGIVQLGELAEMCLGYDFNTSRSHTLNLIGGIRAAAGQGKLEMLGRYDCFRRETDSSDFYPLVPMEKEHFHKYWLNVGGLFRNSRNWDVHTYIPGLEWMNTCYRDIHCADRRQALDWLLAFRPKRLEPKDGLQGSEEVGRAPDEIGKV